MEIQVFWSSPKLFFNVISGIIRVLTKEEKGFWILVRAEFYISINHRLPLIPGKILVLWEIWRGNICSLTRLTNSDIWKENRFSTWPANITNLCNSSLDLIPGKYPCGHHRTNQDIPLHISFWEHTFLARMRSLKNGWPLLALPRAYFSHPLLLKIFFLVKADIQQLSPPKNEKFWWKLKEYKQYLHPTGVFFRVKIQIWNNG